MSPAAYVIGMSASDRTRVNPGSVTGLRHSECLACKQESARDGLIPQASQAFLPSEHFEDIEYAR